MKNKKQSNDDIFENKIEAKLKLRKKKQKESMFKFNKTHTKINQDRNNDFKKDFISKPDIKINSLQVSSEISNKYFQKNDFEEVVRSIVALIASNDIKDVLYGVYQLKDHLNTLLILNRNNIGFCFPNAFYDINLNIKLSITLDNNFNNSELTYNILIIFFELLTRCPRNVNFSLYTDEGMCKSLLRILDNFIEIKTLTSDNYQNNPPELLHLSRLVEVTLTLLGNLFQEDKSFVLFYEKSTKLLDKIESISKICKQCQRNIDIKIVKKSLLYNLCCWSVYAGYLAFETYFKLCKQLCLYKYHEFEDKALLICALKDLCSLNDFGLNHIYNSNIVQEIVLEIYENKNEEDLKIFIPLTFIISQFAKLGDSYVENLIKSKCLDFLIICTKSQEIKKIDKKSFEDLLCQSITGIGNIVFSNKYAASYIINSGLLTICAEEFLNNQNYSVKLSTSYLINKCISHINKENFRYIYNTKVFNKVCDYLLNLQLDIADKKIHIILMDFCFNYIEEGLNILSNGGNVRLFITEIINLKFREVFKALYEFYDKEGIAKFLGFDNKFDVLEKIFKSGCYKKYDYEFDYSHDNKNYGRYYEAKYQKKNYQDVSDFPKTEKNIEEYNKLLANDERNLSIIRNLIPSEYLLDNSPLNVLIAWKKFPDMDLEVFSRIWTQCFKSIVDASRDMKNKGKEKEKILKEDK